MARIYQHFDLAVAGAGGAGVAAALAASRQGLKVALLDREPSLGGTYVQAGFTAFDPVLPRDYLPGLWEISRAHGDQRLLKARDFQQHAYGLLRQEDVFFLPNAWVSGVSMDNGQIEALTCLTREGELTLTADLYIDATGDGDLSAQSGVPFTSGREEDGLCLPPYFCFQVENVPENFSLKALDGDFGRLRGLRFMPSEPGITVKMLFSGVASALSAVDRARTDMELRLSVQDALRELRKLPGMERAALSSLGQRVIFPEGRHPLGHTILDSRDLCTPTAFEDAILEGIASPITLPGMEFMEPVPIARAYTFPYRALLPMRVKNLLLSGRCVSATHRAFGSLSAFHMTLATGCAAGLAAALCVGQKLKPSRVDARELKNRLDAYGCTLQS